MHAETDTEVFIFDETGRKLDAIALHAGENTIQLNRLNSGVYYIRNGQMTKKLIKQ